MASALIQSVAKMASPVATFSLAPAIVVPLVSIIALSILLYYLHSQSTHTKNVKTQPEPTNPSAIGQNRNAGTSKTSLTSLDVRPFMENLQQQHIDARASECCEVKDQGPSIIRPVLSAFARGTLLSLVCGSIYLACAASGIDSKAIRLPLSISVTLIPFLLLPHAISAVLRTFGNSDTVALAKPWQTCFRLCIPLITSFIVGILGTWASSYIVIAVLALTLVTLSVLTFATPCRWPRSMVRGRSRLNGNRKTKSWFSGNVLSKADFEGSAPPGNMPRPGESEEDFLRRMQQEGNSWVTETGKLSANPNTDSDYQFCWQAIRHARDLA